MPDSDSAEKGAQPRLVALEHHGYAIKTWRYLRLAMVAVVFGLFVAVITEQLKATPSCILASISDYYYTPVRRLLRQRDPGPWAVPHLPER